MLWHYSIYLASFRMVLLSCLLHQFSNKYKTGFLAPMANTSEMQWQQMNRTVIALLILGRHSSKFSYRIHNISNLFHNNLKEFNTQVMLASVIQDMLPYCFKNDIKYTHETTPLACAIRRAGLLWYWGYNLLSLSDELTNNTPLDEIPYYKYVQHIEHVIFSDTPSFNWVFRATHNHSLIAIFVEDYITNNVAYQDSIQIPSPISLYQLLEIYQSLFTNLQSRNYICNRHICILEEIADAILSFSYSIENNGVCIARLIQLHIQSIHLLWVCKDHLTHNNTQAKLYFSLDNLLKVSKNNINTEDTTILDIQLKDISILLSLNILKLKQPPVLLLSILKYIDNIYDSISLIHTVNADRYNIAQNTKANLVKMRYKLLSLHISSSNIEILLDMKNNYLTKDHIISCLSNSSTLDIKLLQHIYSCDNLEIKYILTKAKEEFNHQPNP